MLRIKNISFATLKYQEAKGSSVFYLRFTLLEGDFPRKRKKCLDDLYRNGLLLEDVGNSSCITVVHVKRYGFAIAFFVVSFFVIIIIFST